MKNLVFVLWLILWPISDSLYSLIMAKKIKIEGGIYKKYSDTVQAWSALITIIVWIYVAMLLFEK